MAATRCHWRVLIVALLAILPLISLQSHTASAHAALIDTEPVSGAVLDAAPERVTLSFTEPVDLVDGGYRLFGGEGVIGTLEAESSGSDVVVMLPDDLPDGSYVVDWRVVSLDSHPISGALPFSIGSPGSAPVAAPAATDITPEMGVVQGIAYLALLAAVGLAIFNLIAGDWSRDSRLIGALALVAVVAHILLIPLTEINAEGKGLSTLFHGETWSGDASDHPLVAAIVVSIGLGVMWAGVAYRFGRDDLPGRWNWLRPAAIVAGAGMALFSMSLVGHTQSVEPTPGMVGSDLVHGIATATWFGGLIGLALWLRRTGRTDPQGAARMVGRFSVVAGIVFLVAASTGAYMAFQIVGSLDALLETTYGRLLIAKVTVLLVPFGLAAWNRFALVPAVERQPDAASAWRRLRASIMGETVALVVVIAITGFLVLQSPQVGTAAGTTPVATVPYEDVLSLNEDGTIGIRIDPGGLGDNQMVVTILDASGQPAPLQAPPTVQLTLPEEDLGPLDVTLADTANPGEYAGTIHVPLEGDWSISVTTRQTRFEQFVTTVTVRFPQTGE